MANATTGVPWTFFPMTVEEEHVDVFDKMISSLNLAEQNASASLLTDSSLLEKTFQSLLQLASMEDGEGEYEEMMEALELKFTEKLEELVVAGMVEEDDYIDILGDEDEDASEEGSDDEAYESQDDEDEAYESEDEEEEEVLAKPSKSKSKKLSAKDELEMLMAPTGDAEEEEDDEDLDEEEEESVHYSDDENKMDLFNEDEEESSGKFSSFERAQVALRSQIASLEDENVDSERPWALRGEISARQRPSDSLLEEAVEFEHTSRPVPQITEERTEAIEDVIKRRITEAAWDDVERKDGRDLTLLNGMAAPVKGPRKLLEDVATAQPQRSLTQVYEDDLKTKLTGESAGDAESKEKRAELTSLFAKICRHIDGLSGNRFAPKVYAHSEIQIKTLGGRK